MSRCFPFPPPGYERKNRPEDLDLLKEAKRKEKKHKKEKKDKERKKEKEKKDGTDDKQRGEKDRKEKRKGKKEKQHNDKKDKEEPIKDKEKSSISGESTVSAKLDEKRDERLHPKGLSKSKNNVVHEGKGLSLFQTPSQSSPPSKAICESNFAQELDRRVKEDKGRGSQLPDRISTLHNRDREVQNSYKVVSEEKGNKKDCRVDYGKTDLDRLKNEFEGGTMVQNHIPLAESKIDDFPGLPKRQNDRTLEGKFKLKEPGESKGGDKHKKNHGKEKGTEKENKKEKVEVRSEEDMLKVVGSNYVGVNGRKNTDNLKDVNTSAEGNIRKRKDIDTNGFIHGTETHPNKIRRHASHESTENKRKLESSQTTGKSSYDKPIVYNHIHADNKDGLINGMTECHKPSPSKPNSFVPNVTSAHFSALVRDDIFLNEMMILPTAEGQITEASRRLPHPDSRYLTKILSVPIVGDLSENDDQEWLFSKKCRSDKPEVGLKELCVWSEALHIKSADICALPYVIPY